MGRFDMRMLVALAAGSIFGIGLVVSDMVNPARVQAFLDPFGAWDPTLAFVMGGAIIPMLVAWALTPGRKPVFAGAFPAMRTVIDAKLIGGGAMFGAGWCLAGFCPGPALAALSIGGGGLILFLAAMLAGIGAFRMTIGVRVSA